MKIPSTSASPFIKPLKPWMNNNPAAKPAPIGKPLPRPIGKPLVKPLFVGSRKPLAVTPQTPSATPDASSMRFKGPMLQTSGLENSELATANPDPAPPDPTWRAPTLDGLVKVWGTADPNYDFTGDGTVNVLDLLHMINNWETFYPPSAPQQLPKDELVTADQPVLTTNSAMAEANENVTGRDEMSPSDAIAAAGDEQLADNTVDGKPQTEIASNVADDVAIPTDVKPEPDLEAEPALVQATDVPSPSTDQPLNLREYLSSLQSDGSRRVAVRGLNGAAARATIAPDAARNAGAARGMGGLKPLADSIFDHLASAGFADQPPTNIRELIDALNLSPRQTDFMLKQLMMKYPNGLGVNVIA